MKEGTQMNIIWLGHSGFRIEIEGAVLLIDPWLTGNPMFPADQRAAAIQGVTHILLTHGHGDHIGDSVAIARELDVAIYGIYDLMGFLAARDSIKIVGFNKGGTVVLNGAKVTLVNACHSSSTEGGNVGSEAGFMIAGDDHTIYLSGDTDIMADMDWMGDYHKPDIGILSAGGHFTMDMKRAAYAARRYFNFKTVIPCHYRTFPMLEQNADNLRAGLPGVQVIEPQVMQPITL
jgi:L-ascorbate metabolism protein UlaG (beta-lactamase superfamily)